MQNPPMLCILMMFSLSPRGVDVWTIDMWKAPSTGAKTEIGSWYELKFRQIAHTHRVCSEIEPNRRRGLCECACLQSVSKILTADFLFGEANLFSFYISCCILAASCRCLTFYEQRTSNSPAKGHCIVSFLWRGWWNIVFHFYLLKWIGLHLEDGKMQAPGVIRFVCIALTHAQTEHSRII